MKSDTSFLFTGASLSLFGCYWNDDGTTLPDKQLTATSTVDCIHICLTVNPSYIYAGTQKVCTCYQMMRGLLKEIRQSLF